MAWRTMTESQRQGESLPKVGQLGYTGISTEFHAPKKFRRPETAKNYIVQNPNTPWDCHICRPIDSPIHPNVGKYGSPMEFLRLPNLKEPVPKWNLNQRSLGAARAARAPLKQWSQEDKVVPIPVCTILSVIQARV